jgi:hypothetical protein
MKMRNLVKLPAAAAMIVVALMPAHAHVDDVPTAYLECTVSVDSNDTLNVRTRPHGIIVATLLNRESVYVQDQVDDWAFITATKKQYSHDVVGWVKMSPHLKNCQRVDGE